MYNILRKLILRKYYATKEEAIERVDVAYSMQKINAEQYAELTALIEEKYPSEEV